MDYTDFNDNGVELFTHRKYKAAEKAFWEAFRLSPSSPFVLFNLGRTKQELKQFTYAETFYRAAIVQGSVDALYELALLLRGQNRETQAKACLRAFLKLYKDKDEFTELAKSIINGNLTLVWSKPPKIISQKTNQNL